MAMQQAINAQGIEAGWRGPEPASGAEITQGYLDEIIDGYPRLNYAIDETDTVNVLQLAADFDTFLAEENAAAAVEADDEIDAATIKADANVKALILARPAGIETYIDNNVTDLASAKETLKILAKAISAIGKRQFR